MRLILDTHILIWAFFADDLLSDRFKELILEPDNQIYCSTISLWEAALKYDRHPDNFPFAPEMLQDLCDDAGFGILPLRTSHVLELGGLRTKDNARPHNDPFDRILLAQAKAEGAVLLTHDRKFAGYSESCFIVD